MIDSVSEVGFDYSGRHVVRKAKDGMENIPGGSNGVAAVGEGCQQYTAILPTSLTPY
jgi:hypothetical protein